LIGSFGGVISVAGSICVRVAVGRIFGRVVVASISGCGCRRRRGSRLGGLRAGLVRIVVVVIGVDVSVGIERVVIGG
jgi:hypothetical protein